MFCSLSRNNTENIAVIFGEENQFCIVYFNLNKMWILCKKKKKQSDGSGPVRDGVSTLFLVSPTEPNYRPCTECIEQPSEDSEK